MIKIQGEGKSHDSLIGDAKSNQMIRIKDGSYSYQNQIGFQGLDFEAEEGESVCIMGPNGAGKSTLLKAVVGLYPLDEGTYDFCGQRIDAVFLKDRKKSGKLYQQIGFVFQNSEIQLFNTSVYDEIAFGPRNLGLAEEEVKERVEDCLYLLQIENLRDRIPYQLSGGEQKLVAIDCILSSLTNRLTVFRASTVERSAKSSKNSERRERRLLFRVITSTKLKIWSMKFIFFQKGTRSSKRLRQAI